MSASAVTSPTTTATRRAAAGSRGWAAAGVVAGLAGVASIYLSLSLSPAYDRDNPPTPELITEHLGGVIPQLIGFHVATVVAALLLIPFAAGLYRRLAGQSPARSVLPAVAATGLGVLSAVLVLGSGLDTEFVFGLSDPALMTATDVSIYSHWVATIAWLWVTAGVSALALGIAALRHGAAGKALGVTSVVLGSLMVLFGVSPLQYMAGFIGPVWLLVSALALLRGERAAR
ncbi:hypothetical protein [Georgenia ruanii]|uniref:DUF4386 family protein n=1 Tax=Georgenia ruanii TaxID=348442 RepID=A0A7J9UX56_9MICO|nr:hypothetical protein [Georgenia ruanii]MPV89211.1 hypothetical protein [Georgenia ruanii]